MIYFHRTIYGLILVLCLRYTHFKITNYIGTRTYKCVTNVLNYILRLLVENDSFNAVLSNYYVINLLINTDIVLYN